MLIHVHNKIKIHKGLKGLEFNPLPRLIKVYHFQSKKFNNNNDVDYSKDYYKILGLSKSASEAEIKSAYRKLAKIHHPDVNNNSKAAAEKFKEITSAYEVLSDKTKKTSYDSGFGSSFSGSQGSNHQRQNPFSGFGFGKKSDFYSNFNFDSDSKGKEEKGKAFKYQFKYKDPRTGQTRTYSYTSHDQNKNNIFYKDLDEMLKKKRMERERREKEGNNDHYYNPFDQFNSNSSNNKNYDNNHDNNSHKSYKNNENQDFYNEKYNYQMEMKYYETMKIMKWVCFCFVFVWFYGKILKKRREYYENSAYDYSKRQYSHSDYLGSVPDDYQRSTGVYGNSKTNYDNRMYFNRDEVPPYK